MTCREKILSEDYWELLLDYEPLAGSGQREGADYCITSVGDGISIVYYRMLTGGMPQMNSFPYYEIPKCYGLMQQEIGAGVGFDTFALTDAGILQVQEPPLSLTGRGVVIAFLDTGIRYTQEAFLDAYGESRILSIWDQTLSEGEAPEDFLYGTEYTREQINEALRAENPRMLVKSWDESGHGTAMASAAAGSRINGGRTFTGAAPDAQLVVIKLRQAKQYLRDYYLLPEGADAYSEADIMMAVRYAERYAVALQRPLILCLGIGTSYGSHTGTSLLDRYLNAVTGRRSRAAVICGGNEGASGHHVQGLSTQGRTQTAELRVGEGGRGFLMEVWSEAPSRFSLSVRTPGGELVSGIDGRSVQVQEYRFVFDKTLLTVRGTPVEESSGMRLLLLRFENPTPGVWTFTIDVEELLLSGIGYHIWLPIDAFLGSDTYFLRPEPDTTLTEPSMASGPISITAYDDESGGFYEKSGRGFTADRRVKPEFAAPGVEIPTSIGRRTGSSLAAALAAGAAAQMMQWAVVEGNYPLATGRELKYYLALGAVRESGISYPSREWGLGKINVQRTFQELAGLF
jgi:hypothetical protein